MQPLGDSGGIGKGGFALGRRAHLTPIVPFSAILLICFVWLLLHLFVWWQCTATYADAAIFWLGTGSLALSPLSLLLTITILCGLLVCSEWRFERVVLGVRDWKRSCIYTLGLVVASSLAALFLQVVAMIGSL